MNVDLGNFQLYMSSGSKSWDLRSETERRIFHNFWNNKFGQPLTAESITWINEEGFAEERHNIIYGFTPTPPPSPEGALHSVGSDSFGGYYSGDDNSTVYLMNMADNMSDLNDEGERSQVSPFQSSTFIQNLEGSAVPAGNQEVNLGRGVNEEHNIIFNPLAPPTGFGRLSGGVMYPLPNTSSPEGFPSITSSPKVQTLPVFTKTVRGFDTPDLVNTSLNISTRPMLLIETGTKLDHYYMTRFVAQCINPEFHSNIKGLISPEMWLTLLQMAKTRHFDDPIKVKNINLLVSYIVRLPHQPEVDISDVWTKDLILQLLKDLFPKESHNTNTVNNITVRYSAVVWRFDYADESVERDTIKNIFTILRDRGQAKLSEEQELTIIKLWWKNFQRNSKI